MVRGLYLSATNMVVQRRKLDMVSNNIANVETTGYKSETLISRSFQDMLISRVDDGYTNTPAETIGTLNTGVHIDEVVVSFAQGAPKETSSDTDFALIGDGFFVVATPDGDRYTRDGSFVVNSEGYLVNASGHYLTDAYGGYIQVGSGKVSVDSLGNVASDGEAVGRIRLVQFENNADLRRAGYNLYVNDNNQQMTEPVDCEIKQGFLEGSNVEIANEMVDAMGIYRNYETSQRVIRMIDETLQKAVNEIGRV